MKKIEELEQLTQGDNLNEQEPNEFTNALIEHEEAQINKKIQISISMLQEIRKDQKLGDLFIETIMNNEDMKAPIAFQFAKALKKQTKIQF